MVTLISHFIFVTLCLIQVSSTVLIMVVVIIQLRFFAVNGTKLIDFFMPSDMFQIYTVFTNLAEILFINAKTSHTVL